MLNSHLNSLHIAELPDEILSFRLLTYYGDYKVAGKPEPLQDKKLLNSTSDLAAYLPKPTLGPAQMIGHVLGRRKAPFRRVKGLRNHCRVMQTALHPAPTRGYWETELLKYKTWQNLRSSQTQRRLLGSGKKEGRAPDPATGFWKNHVINIPTRNRETNRQELESQLTKL